MVNFRRHTPEADCGLYLHDPIYACIPLVRFGTHDNDGHGHCVVSAGPLGALQHTGRRRKVF